MGKGTSMRKIIIAGLALSSFVLAATGWAWDPDEAEEYHAKAQEAIATFKEEDPSIQKFFDIFNVVFKS